jgi:DNA-binding MarR family transcriptional regulator
MPPARPRSAAQRAPSVRRKSAGITRVARTASAHNEPPPRIGGRTPGPAPGSEAEVNRFIAAYIMGVANRLASGASNYYRAHFDIGMSEWRALMAIGTSSHRIVREVAEMADLDYAAASKSLKLLQQRGLVDIEQTKSRGRAAIASLTPHGLDVWRRMRAAARARQRRLLAAFTPAEIETLWSLLRRVEAQVPAMNAEP